MLKEYIGKEYLVKDGSVVVVVGSCGRFLDIEVQEAGEGRQPNDQEVVTDYVFFGRIKSGEYKEFP